MAQCNALSWAPAATAMMTLMSAAMPPVLGHGPQFHGAGCCTNAIMKNSVAEVLGLLVWAQGWN